MFENMHVRNSSLSSFRGLAIPACLISCNCARVVARPAGPSGRGPYTYFIIVTDTGSHFTQLSRVLEL